MPTPTLQERKAALYARTSDDALIGSLHILDGQPAGPDRNLVRAWTIEELERRFPAAAAAVEAAFDQAEAEITAGTGTGDVDYVAVLLAAIAASR